MNIKITIEPVLMQYTLSMLDGSKIVVIAYSEEQAIMTAKNPQRIRI